MKDWVKPFLEQKLKGSYSESAAYYYLVSCLRQYDFGGALGWPVEPFMEALGSVLSDVPEKVFKQISQMENLFFVFTPFPGAEVKVFQLEHDLKAGMLRIVNFPFDTAFMPLKAMRGEVAHELAHIFGEHEVPSDEAEDEADRIVKEWGLGDELDAFRDYEQKQEYVSEMKGGDLK